MHVYVCVCVCVCMYVYTYASKHVMSSSYRRSCFRLYW